MRYVDCFATLAMTASAHILSIFVILGKVEGFFIGFLDKLGMTIAPT